MTAEFDALTQQVAETISAEQSAILLLQDLKARLDAALASDDPPAAIQALRDQLDANEQALAAAVVANTPTV